MSNNLVALQPLPEQGWRNGFASLLRKENRMWSSGLRGLAQCAIWISVFNLLVAFVLFIVPHIQPIKAAPAGMDNPLLMGLTMFFNLLTALGPIGAIILAHDKIVGEKQIGTAAWILSKPVTRSAFVLSKLVSSTLRLGILAVAIPGLVAFAEISLAVGKPIDGIAFFLATGAAFTTVLFYLTLALMLSAIFDGRGEILAISFGIMFGLQVVANFIPQTGLVTPLNVLPSVMALAQGQHLPISGIAPIVFSVLWSIVFAGFAVWRFSQEEF